MTRHLALDLSLSCSGWATTDDTDDIVSGTLTPRIRGTTRWNNLRGGHRLAWITDEILAILARHPPDFIGIEDYPYGIRSSSVTKLAELGGAVRVALHEADIPWVAINVKHIKLYATGNGNPGKPAMVAAAQQQLAYRGTSNDEADALWLHALIAAALGNPRVQATGRRLDALEPVTAALDSIRSRPRTS